MSLIRVRRKRKKRWIDAKKGASTWKLTALFLIVVVVIWYLETRF